jgi:hypothetical protein
MFFADILSSRWLCSHRSCVTEHSKNYREGSTGRLGFLPDAGTSFGKAAATGGRRCARCRVLGAAAGPNPKPECNLGQFICREFSESTCMNPLVAGSTCLNLAPVQRLQYGSRTYRYRQAYRSTCFNFIYHLPATQLLTLLPCFALLPSHTNEHVSQQQCQRETIEG